MSSVYSPPHHDFDGSNHVMTRRGHVGRKSNMATAKWRLNDLETQDSLLIESILSQDEEKDVVSMMVLAKEIDSGSPIPSFCTSTQMCYRDPTRRPLSPPLSPLAPHTRPAAGQNDDDTLVKTPLGKQPSVAAMNELNFAKDRSKNFMETSDDLPNSVNRPAPSPGHDPLYDAPAADIPQARANDFHDDRHKYGDRLATSPATGHDVDDEPGNEATGGVQDASDESGDAGGEKWEGMDERPNSRGGPGKQEKKDNEVGEDVGEDDHVSVGSTRNLGETDESAEEGPADGDSDSEYTSLHAVSSRLKMIDALLYKMTDKS